jgi:hypothetical protein
MFTYEENVSAGIEFLDNDKPDWREYIDVATLDMTCCENCILGQVYGSTRNTIFFDGQYHDWDKMEELGFESLLESGYDSLQEEWVRQLATTLV